VWSSDITYIRPWQALLHMAIIMGRF
jgi:hypothetical protein